MSAISKDIESHYQAGQESQRLFVDPVGQLERLRTLAILAAHLPPPPAVVYDVGGAAGVYAFPLAQQGYQVHLIDPVDLHLQQAKAHASESGIALASITAGDARKLDIPDHSADAVLMLGPLYHLVEQQDRLAALREARRILKPAGLLLAAAVSRFASLIDGLRLGFFADQQFRKIVAADLATGQHRNPTNHPHYFITAYLHRPEDLAAEVQQSGFADVRLLGVEGPGWSATRFAEAWDDPAQRAPLLEFLSTVEAEPSIVGASSHVIALANAAESS